VATITHEQKIICSKKFRRNAGSGHCLREVICKSPGGHSANETEEKMHRIIIAPFFGKQGKDIAS